MILARIGPNDPRKRTWLRCFGSASVPIIAAEPANTALPDGEILPCFFVDFRFTSAALRDNLIEFARHQPEPRASQLLGMLSEGVYPIHADGVTVVEAPDSFFMRSA